MIFYSRTCSYVSHLSRAPNPSLQCPTSRCDQAPNLWAIVRHFPQYRLYVSFRWITDWLDFWHPVSEIPYLDVTYWIFSSLLSGGSTVQECETHPQLKEGLPRGKMRCSSHPFLKVWELFWFYWDRYEAFVWPGLSMRQEVGTDGYLASWRRATCHMVLYLPRPLTIMPKKYSAQLRYAAMNQTLWRAIRTKK